MSELNNKWANASKNLKMAWLLSIVGCITFCISSPIAGFLPIKTNSEFKNNSTKKK